MSSLPLRQTALSGPIDPTHGWPSFLDWAGVPLGYVPVTTNVSATHPLIVTAARGFGATGAQDRIGLTTTNLSWPAVPHDGNFYLYVDVQSNGTLVPGFTTLKPIYQEYGSPSTVAGQHTYNVLEATMYVGDGTTASRVWRVFIGEGWAGAAEGRIVALRAYGYLGRWTSDLRPFPGPGSYDRIDDWFIPGPLKTARWVGVCIAADGNYLPKNELPLSAFGDYFIEVIDPSGYERVDTAALPAQIFDGSGNGTRTNLNPTHWQLKCYLTRSW